MNPLSNTLTDLHAEPRALAPTAIPASRRFFWSVRRELWESRSVYIAPLAVAALIVIGLFVGALHHRFMLSGATLPPEQQAQFFQAYDFAALLLMATTFLVAIFYSLDALYGERRDRSILFWKSLPVSDLTTVLSKISIPVIVLPLLTFAITAVTQALMLLIGTTVLGISVTAGVHPPLFSMWVMLLYHLLIVHGLWYAPIYAYLLLVSAWARRAPFLWAALPPLAIGVVEKIAFRTTHFASMLENRIAGGSNDAPFTSADMAMHASSPLSLGRFLFDPGLWIGLAIAAIFLAGAVWLRRSRDPN